MAHNYTVFRCNPLALQEKKPWWRETEICPCDSQFNNETGRGFVSCPYGIENEKLAKFGRIPTVPNPQEVKQKMTGSLVQDKQWIPPQLNPRPLSRIGQQWRSSN